MDELLFRSSQKIENLQIQLSLATSQGKDWLQQYSTQGKAVALQTWNSPYLIHLRENVQELIRHVMNEIYHVQSQVLFYMDPRRMYHNLASILLTRWTKRDWYFLGLGFTCGSIAGIIIARVICKKGPTVRYMQAIQCSQYLGTESASVVEDAFAPSDCGQNDVLVTVKAASVQVVDAKICNGYGRTLRRILRKLHKQSNDGLPVTLGRDCAGVVVDLGQNVKRLEVGDEVWLTVPFWSCGTLAQTVLVPDNWVAKKPQNIGFEAACSVPYAGSLALDALREVDVLEENAEGQRVLILGGCTPAGCVLIQVLKHWEAHITTTCFKRGVPVAKALGASDIIIYPDALKSNDDSLESQNEIAAFHNELHLKDKFNTIVVTQDCKLSNSDIIGWCSRGSNGVVWTTPPECPSDSYGLVGSFIFGTYVRLKYFLERIIGMPNDNFDEAHLCYVALNELADLVETGHLQTVVDKVFHPQDIEIALNHIQSAESIGSTVVTFR